MISLHLRGTRPRSSRTNGKAVILVAHPSADLYGSDRMMLESVRGFLDAGRDVVVVVPTAGPLVEHLEAAGARVVCLPMPVLRKASLSPRGLVAMSATAARSLIPSVSLLARIRPEAVYVSTLTLPSWTVLARVTGHRTICHVHEAERHHNPLVGLGMTLPLLCAHELILNSRYSASVLTDSIRFLASRIRLVHNGVAGPSVVMGRPERLLGPLRVLYLGRLSPRKGPDVAAAAVREVRRQGVPAALSIVGSVFPGYEWFDRRLREEYADLIDSGVVHIHGFTTDVWRHLASADVVVVPSTMPEPFGNTAVEAMLAGRPVIVSGSGGLPEAVTECPSALVVPPAEVEGLAEALALVAQDWPRWRAAALQHRRHAVERFSPQMYRRRIVSVVTASRASAVVPSSLP